MISQEPSLTRRVVTRIARYSMLRSAERALLPSVRRRSKLPSTLLEREVILDLHELLDFVSKGEPGNDESCLAQESIEADEALAESFAPGAVESKLDEIDAGLDLLSGELRALALRTPIGQLRATLPATTQEHPAEVSSLLDLCLEQLRPDDEPPALVDYIITLLASSFSPGVRMLRADPCSVSPGVEAMCASVGDSRDERVLGFAESFRSASLELLELGDVEKLIVRVRELKSRLGGYFFQSEVLRSLVNYNIAVFNRFHRMLENEREHDGDVERILEALRRLDDPQEGTRGQSVTS